MSLLTLTLVVIAVLAGGYVVYGTFIARQYRLDDSRTTPAAERNDGVDFVPTRPFYLLGQHFSAIAAAGPIVGPIAACMAFGWLPSILWILIGVVLIGAVHDFSALVASVRHGAQSIAQIARENLGARAWLALVGFIWIALVYVIVAFTDVTVGTFIGKAPELTAMAPGFDRGGAVASASTMYLLLALIMGFVQRFLRPPMWLATLIFVPATLAAIWLGTQVSSWLVLPTNFWRVAVLVYCFGASLLPMWVLQQPRGYLGGFVLYLAIGVGLVGVLFGGFEIRQPATRPVADYGAWFAGGENAPEMTALIFPFLFVTIACGACSGFHGLVCGGTTSKQVARETHCKPIAFGAMLLEGLVAVIALATIMIVAPDPNKKPNPAAVYGDGIAEFLCVIIGRSPETLIFAKTFGTMAVATFVFDTLDVSTRLGRYLLQELTGRKGWLSGALAAGATAGVPLLILAGAPDGSWRLFWTLFGTSNQLLAALTLLGVTVWLVREGRRCWYTLFPMLFVMTITVSALLFQIVHAARVFANPPPGAAGDAARSALRDPAVINGVVAVGLLVLAGVFVAESLRAIAATRRARTLAAM